MCLAFLPTAVLGVLSLVMIFGVMAVTLFIPGTFLTGLILVVICCMCFALSEMAAFRMYTSMMERVTEDLALWRRTMKRVVRVCSGNLKTAVMLDMAECLCQLEEVELAENVLRSVKKRVMKCGRADFRFRYLLMLIVLHRLHRDERHVRELFASAYDCLKEKQFYGEEEREICQERFEYERIKTLLSSAFHRASADNNRELILRLQQCALRHAESCISDREYMHSLIVDAYHIGLTHLLLGDETAAQKYFRNILSCPFEGRMRSRLQRYTETRNAAILLRTLP